MESIDVLIDAARAFLHEAAAFLPRLVLASIVILGGWLIAKAVRFAVEKALRAFNFNVLTERAGTDHFLRQGGMRGDTTTLFGRLAQGAVILAALLVACNLLGLAYFAELLGRIVLFMPKVLVAIVVVTFGSYFARFVGGAVQSFCIEAAIPDAELLGRIARTLVMALVVMTALTQIEVGGDIVQKIFLIILAGLVLALALAFGIGGRDWAAAMLQRWWPHRRKD